MPVLHSRKQFQDSSFYHVFGRGRSKQDIFRSDTDKKFFLSLLKRYLSKRQELNRKGMPYDTFYGRLELNAFCLMDNHLHFLLYIDDSKALEALMQRVICCYSTYFNKKYKESGPLLESRYKAKLVDNEVYFSHIAKYIDLNPYDWKNYSFSSFHYLKNGYNPDWFKPRKIQAQFGGFENYRLYLEELDDHRKTISAYKLLAGFEE